MKRLISLVLFMLPGAVLAEQYLCVGELSAGFILDKSMKKWKQTHFYPNRKYIVAPSATDTYKYTVKAVYSDFSPVVGYCEKDFSVKGHLYCDDGADSFVMNNTNGRFIYASELDGYTHTYQTPTSDDGPNTGTPNMTIGKCSKF
jgi:hypothetical protein